MNEKTRAIVVTHMWGMPYDMTNIMAIANSHGIAVIEDCSHAHGATTNGKIVGSLGTAAAGVCRGKNCNRRRGRNSCYEQRRPFYRALAHGYYNKRCKAEIPQDHLLHDFSITGLGLKLRAHPLAIALAENQLSRLDGWLKKNANLRPHHRWSRRYSVSDVATK
ncbi:DegT/DnrJ/EryC1/StrS family aminotransferase [Agrobacterium pusense]|uniref:DegT/DnrJ/EryC1/StrS family aminotransferase n=1 Tax=Agrobacterium pusense TaxID=648995 RepID=UPI0039C93F0F